MLWSAMKVDSLLTTVLQKQSFFCICFSVCPICRHLQTTLLLINVITEDLWRKLFVQLLCFAQLQRLLELLLPLFHIIFQQFLGRRSIPSWISSCMGFRKSNKLKAKMKELVSRKLKKYHGEDNFNVDCSDSDNRSCRKIFEWVVTHRVVGTTLWVVAATLRVVARLFE